MVAKNWNVDHYFLFQTLRKSAWTVVQHQLRSGEEGREASTCAMHVDCTRRWMGRTDPWWGPKGGWHCPKRVEPCAVTVAHLSLPSGAEMAVDSQYAMPVDCTSSFTRLVEEKYEFNYPSYASYAINYKKPFKTNLQPEIANKKQMVNCRLKGRERLRQLSCNKL